LTGKADFENIKIGSGISGKLNLKMQNFQR